MLRTMLRSFILVVALLFWVAPAAASGPVDRYQLAFPEESTMPLDDELAACVGYAGTVFEERYYDVKVTEFIGGPREGRVHITGTVSGTFLIAPGTEESGPTYTGTYREMVTFIGTSFDDPRVAAFAVPGRATGSDGSSLRFLVHGHIVVGPDDEVRLMNLKFHCIR